MNVQQSFESSQEEVRNHTWKRCTWTKQYQDYLKYIQVRNAATKDERRAKRDHEKKLASDIKTNPTSFWKYARSKTNVEAGMHTRTVKKQRY